MKSEVQKARFLRSTLVREWDEEDGLKTADWELPLRFFFRYELEHLMERSEINGYIIKGDYAGNELFETSKLIKTCAKERSNTPPVRLIAHQPLRPSN